MKKAIIIGSTGLTGSYILKYLLDDSRYSKIVVFVRKATGISHSKLEEKIVNFDDIELWKNLITGDELFSALGTTIKKAGSKENQYRIDVIYNYLVAKHAVQNGIKNYYLVSSIGANKNSKNFYLKIKGELDSMVSDLPFEHITIFRPSMLLGNRGEVRLLENISLPIINFLTNLPLLKKYKPIKAANLARAMIRKANMENKNKIDIISSEDIMW